MCGMTVHERPGVFTLQAQAWAVAEHSLASRLRKAETNAAAAAAREAAAEEALGALQVRAGVLHVQHPAWQAEHAQCRPASWRGVVLTNAYAEQPALPGLVLSCFVTFLSSCERMLVQLVAMSCRLLSCTRWLLCRCGWQQLRHQQPQPSQQLMRPRRAPQGQSNG